MLSPEPTPQQLRELLAFRPSLLYFLQSRFPTVPDHDDLVQEVIVKAWLQSRDGKLRNPRAFLFTALRNAAITYIRRDQASPYVDVAADLVHTIPAEGDRVRSQTECGDLRAALARLPARARQMLELRRLQGWSHREISSHCGVSVKTVEMNIHRALRLLRADLVQAREQ